MKQNPERLSTGRVSASKLRNIINEFTNQLLGTRERVAVAISDNTFRIHIDGEILNISVSPKGGAA